MDIKTWEDKEDGCWRYSFKKNGKNYGGRAYGGKNPEARIIEMAVKKFSEV